MKFVKNQYYKKDKKAQIYRERDGGQDSHGFYVEGGYYPIAPSPVWCYATQLTQDQVFQAAHWGENETRLFVFNYYGKVDLYDHVKYKDEWYSITRVDTADDYNGEMFVYCKKERAPKDSDIMDYDPTKW